jgi:alpha-L-fucosidase
MLDIREKKLYLFIPLWFLSTLYSNKQNSVLMRFFMKGMTLLLFLTLYFSSVHPLKAQQITIDRNKPERKSWFQDMGFGMMIHWSVDVQLGAMISRSVAASSKAYQHHYFNELPKTFDPKSFDPVEWAKLAKLAGMQYVVITAKHHNGFCMWNTQTSSFNIMNTAFGKDALKEIIDAFRSHELAIGISFSPDDYYVMYQQGHPPSRNSPDSESTRNAALWDVNKKQLKELLTNYGEIDILFINEKSDWANPLVANYAWELSPDLVVTRGGMPSPEQYIPEEIEAVPWEGCFSMGVHWQHVPDDAYKSATTLINLLIETRAKGGNFLLNVAPDAEGKIPTAQEDRLREIALWNMANHEAVANTRPWKTPKEENTWFVQSKDTKYVYAFVNEPYWNWMEEKAFFFRSMRGGKTTRATVLGQNDEMMEFHVHRSPAPVVSVTDDGIFVNVVKAQPFTKNWENPMVIRFEAVE